MAASALADSGVVSLSLFLSLFLFLRVLLLELFLFLEIVRFAFARVLRFLPPSYSRLSGE